MRKTQRLRQLLAGDGIVLGGGAQMRSMSGFTEGASSTVATASVSGANALAGMPTSSASRPAPSTALDQVRL